MADASLLPIANLALRAGLATLLLFAAALLLRDHPRAVRARLGAAFALGVAAHALQALAPPGSGWRAALQVLSAGNAAVFWLFARALFDDDFRLRPWYGALWLTLAAAAFATCGWLGTADPASARVLGTGLTLATLGLALHAVARTLASWRADLVEGRRRLRGFVVGAGAAYTAAYGITLLAWRGDALPPAAPLLDAVVLLGLALAVLWHLLGAPERGLLAEPAPPVAQAPVLSLATAMPVPTADAEAHSEADAGASAPEPIDTRSLAALQRLMQQEHAYRQDGLTIGALADQLGLHEYKLRRLINQGLGYRNFNAFLNRYRIDAVKAALADPAQSELPVLRLAMEAGFQSLGPFNRAFKADTGLTPTEFRRAARSAAGLAETAA